MKSHLKLATHRESSLHPSVKKLSHILADTYLLYLKTQNFHWNVVDERFAMLHAFFETQYKALAEASDEIAERIRMLDAHAPSTFAEFSKISSLAENKTAKNGNDMLKMLLADHEHICSGLKQYIKDLEKSGEDPGTLDLFVERLRDHDKTAWMIRSHL